MTTTSIKLYAILLTLLMCSIAWADQTIGQDVTTEKKQNNDPKKIHMAVYYEALCPDSMTFVNHQLVPIYETFKSFVDILFVPFGKSESENNGKTFYCQHGPAECTGNRLQSCALDELKDDQDKQVQFVSCQMRWDADYTGQNCVGLVGANFTNVNECANGDKGKQLQLEAEKETHLIAKPYPSFVPTVVYNKVFNRRKQSRSQWELRNVICEELELIRSEEDLPEMCLSRRAIKT